MGDWLKKIRGMIGLTAIGGVVGGALGAAYFSVTSLMAGLALTFDGVLMAAQLYGGFAALATAGVGVVLATLGAGRPLSELSAAKAGLVGALLGAAAPLVYAALTIGLPYDLIASIAIRFGAVGGMVGAGLVTVAKRADRQLGAGRSSALLSDGE